MYKKPEENKLVNAAELEYIEQDKESDAVFDQEVKEEVVTKKPSLLEFFKHRSGHSIKWDSICCLSRTGADNRGEPVDDRSGGRKARRQRRADGKRGTS